MRCFAEIGRQEDKNCRLWKRPTWRTNFDDESAIFSSLRLGDIGALFPLLDSSGLRPTDSSVLRFPAAEQSRNLPRTHQPDWAQLPHRRLFQSVGMEFVSDFFCRVERVSTHRFCRPFS